MDQQTDHQARKDALRRKRRYLKCLRRRRDFLRQRVQDLGEDRRSETDRMAQEAGALSWAISIAADAMESESAAIEAETNGG